MGLNDEYRKLAHKYIPAGAHTYSRADDSHPVTMPSVFEKGKDAFLWDLEGNKYLDYGMALRAITVGYNYESISNAAINEILKGNELTRASKTEIDAAKVLVDLIPNVDMVKFAKNGSSVTTAAVKLARAYNGKKYVARCYEHPFFSFDDWFIGDTVMDSGIPDEYKSLTLNFHYNDIDSLKKLFDTYKDQISCVILEPATTEEPKDDFLNKIKTLCHENNSVFILDEMITGFRWHLQGASKYFNVEADLVTFGKGMANGFSVAALGGKKEIMELGGIEHEKERCFLISTTHGAEMCGLGAFIETVNVYKEKNVIDSIWNSGKFIVDTGNEISNRYGLDNNLKFGGFNCSPVFNLYDNNGNVSMELRTLFIQEMLKNGVIMPWIALSYSHGKSELDFTAEALEKSISVVKKAIDGNINDYLIGRAIKPVFRKYNFK